MSDLVFLILMPLLIMRLFEKPFVRECSKVFQYLLVFGSL